MAQSILKSKRGGKGRDGRRRRRNSNGQATVPPPVNTPAAASNVATGGAPEQETCVFPQGPSSRNRTGCCAIPQATREASPAIRTPLPSHQSHLSPARAPPPVRATRSPQRLDNELPPSTGIMDRLASKRAQMIRDDEQREKRRRRLILQDQRKERIREGMEEGEGDEQEQSLMEEEDKPWLYVSDAGIPHVRHRGFLNQCISTAARRFWPNPMTVWKGNPSVQDQEEEFKAEIRSYWRNGPSLDSHWLHSTLMRHLQSRRQSMRDKVRKNAKEVGLRKRPVGMTEEVFNTVMRELNARPGSRVFKRMNQAAPGWSSAKRPKICNPFGRGGYDNFHFRFVDALGRAPTVEECAQAREKGGRHVIELVKRLNQGTPESRGKENMPPVERSDPTIIRGEAPMDSRTIPTGHGQNTLSTAIPVIGEPDNVSSVIRRCQGPVCLERSNSAIGLTQEPMVTVEGKSSSGAVRRGKEPIVDLEWNRLQTQGSVVLSGRYIIPGGPRPEGRKTPTIPMPTVQRSGAKGVVIRDEPMPNIRGEPGVEPWEKGKGILVQDQWNDSGDDEEELEDYYNTSGSGSDSDGAETSERNELENGLNADKVALPTDKAVVVDDVEGNRSDSQLVREIEMEKEKEKVAAEMIEILLPSPCPSVGAESQNLSHVFNLAPGSPKSPQDWDVLMPDSDLNVTYSKRRNGGRVCPPNTMETAELISDLSPDLLMSLQDSPSDHPTKKPRRKGPARRNSKYHK